MFDSLGWSLTACENGVFLLNDCEPRIMPKRDLAVRCSGSISFAKRAGEERLKRRPGRHNFAAIPVTDWLTFYRNGFRICTPRMDCPSDRFSERASAQPAVAAAATISPSQTKFDSGCCNRSRSQWSRALPARRRRSGNRGCVAWRSKVRFQAFVSRRNRIPARPELIWHRFDLWRAPRWRWGPCPVSPSPPNRPNRSGCLCREMSLPPWRSVSVQVGAVDFASPWIAPGIPKSLDHLIDGGIGFRCCFFEELTE